MQSNLNGSNAGKGKGRASDRSSLSHSSSGGRGVHTNAPTAASMAVAQAEARAVRAEEAVTTLRAQVDALQKAKATGGGVNITTTSMESEVEARVARRAAERVAGGKREYKRGRWVGEGLGDELILLQNGTENTS